MRTGLRKEPEKASGNDDFSDEGEELLSQAVSVADPHETVPYLTDSTMKPMEKIVSLDDSTDVLVIQLKMCLLMKLMLIMILIMYQKQPLVHLKAKHLSNKQQVVVQKINLL